MISDSERREVARELRVAASGAYRHVCALDVIATTVGVDPQGKFEREVEQETYAALADLIDPPTCAMVREGGGFRCSACGCELDLDDREGEPTMWLGGGPMTPRHCPNCGAMVTKKEEDDD